MLRSLFLTCAAALCVLASITAAPASASKDLESMFQDDNQLLFNTPEGTRRAMDTLKLLGVDRIRVSVFWATVAPQKEATTKPAGFDGSNPDSYPPGSWDRYDQIVRLARERSIAVNFNVTSPAPFWATGTPPSDRADLKEVFDPRPKEFGDFVVALGKRYSGAWVAGGSLIPRVRYWTIWNEPNQGAWLAPQAARDPRSAKAFVETSPVLYRNLVDAAWSALQLTDHGKDTIIVGETAPKGQKSRLDTSLAMDPLRFLRELYCLDRNLQLYKGTSAQLRSCPVGAKALQEFPAQHPALFQATGYAHHPYALTSAPKVRFSAKDWVTVGNLNDLSKILRRIYQRYRQILPRNAKNVPLYLTEFGYQSNPPDPAGVSAKAQAAYNNESEYLAWRDPAAKTLSQFLLVDDKPVPGSSALARYGRTFQTGLLFDDMKKKPAYSAYAMGIFLPSRRATTTRKLTVWGVARVAPRQKVTVTVEARGRQGSRYRKVGSLKTDGKRGYVFGRVPVTRDGAVRLVYRTKAGRTFRSRAVAFALKRK